MHVLLLRGLGVELSTVGRVCAMVWYAVLVTALAPSPSRTVSRLHCIVYSGHNQN